MKSLVFSVLVVASSAFSATPASASIYTDEFSKCLVSKTNEQDRTLLVQWIYAMMSASPAVKSMSSIDGDTRHSYTIKAAALLDRLVTVDCRTQAVAALKYDGGSAVENSFRLLGEVAMRDLLTDPSVGGELAQLGASVDHKAWTALMKDAGITPLPTTVPPKQ